MNNILQIIIKIIIGMLAVVGMVTLYMRLVMEMPIEMVIDVFIACGSGVVKLYEIQIQMLGLYWYSAMEMDLRSINGGYLILRILFALCHLTTIAFLLSQGNSPANSRRGLTIKNNLKSFGKRSQQKRTYATKRKSTLVPVTLKAEEVRNEFNHKLAVTGTFGATLTYQDMFKMIPIDKPKRPKSSTMFHNSLFATWDIETIPNSKGQECVYMISWVVSKGTKVDKGLIYNMKNWDTEEGKALIVERFLKGLIARMKVVGRANKEIYLYAHNSGLFDIHVIMRQLVKLHAAHRKMMPTVIADNQNDIYQMMITFEGINIFFRDSMKILPISLKSVGLNMLGTDIGKLPVNHDAVRAIMTGGHHEELLKTWNPMTLKMVNGDAEFAKGFINPYAYLREYCLQDSVVVSEALKKFSLELRKLGYSIQVQESITASSIGMKVWKANFNSLDNPIMQINMNTNMHTALDAAYYGGRVEVFDSALGLSPLYHFDVPGLYAGMMCKELPIGNPVYVSKFNSSNEDFHKLVLGLPEAGLIGFFKCEVVTPDNLNLPVLPVKHNGKLTFPLGTFTGTWSTVELEEAINIGYNLTPIDGWVFKTGTPLKGYSEKITFLKDKAGAEGNKAVRTLMKLLTNSLYGKLASKYFTSATAVIKNDDFKTINDIYKLNAITKLDEGHMMINYNVKPIPNADVDKDLMQKAFIRSTKALTDKDLNIAVAATVTAQGRIQLYKLMKEVIARGGQMCYVDTDSVFCTLPEAPFNKPFGPYTWVGPAEEHTFPKALFIAPKMYYHVDMTGKETFKVKGVNTKKSEYSYEDLVALFVKRESIKFVDQTQYRRVPKVQGTGIMITEGLTKAYDLGTRSKRTWVIRATEAHTTPIMLRLANTKAAKAIKGLPTTNLTLAVKTIEDMLHTTPHTTTTRTTVLGGITQNLGVNENRVRIRLPIDAIDDNFVGIWTHAISTASFNCLDDEGKVTHTDNIQYAQILIVDGNKNVWKTVAYFKGYEWIGYTLDEILTEIKDQIDVLNQHYRSAYNWTDICVKINFTLQPEMVTFNADTIMAKAIQDVGAAAKAFNERLETKEAIKRLERKMEAIAKLEPLSKQIIRGIKNAQRTILNQFIKEVKLDLYQKSTLKRIADEDLRKILRTLKLPREIESSELRNILREALVKSIELTIGKEFKLSYHAWVNSITKVLKIDLTEERVMRNMHTLVYRAIITLVKSEHLEHYRKDMKFFDRESGSVKTAPGSFILSDKWNAVQSTIYQIGLLRRISFTPKIEKYDPDSSDVALRSKDKVEQINKMNRVKVFFRPTYRKYFKTVLFPILNDQEKFMKTIGLRTNSQFNACLIEMRRNIACLLYLETLILTLGQPFYYNTYFRDRRGRIYTNLTHFRHIGPKWLRPLFCTEKSAIAIARTWPKILEIRGFRPQKVVEIRVYWAKVGEELNINIRQFNTPKELLTNINRMETVELKPTLIARKLEIQYILEEQKPLRTTSPFQIDMKNNAIQHAATIVNNLDSILATGIIPSDSKYDDLYTKIAKKTLNIIAANRNIIEFAEISAKFPNNTREDRDNSIKNLRAIAKKPTIVTIYAATKRTIIQYVYEALEDLNITITYSRKRLLARIIIKTSLEASPKEVELMNLMKKLVVKGKNTITWNFGELSDFEPKETYNQIIQKELKIRFEGVQFHTSYNILTHKADTQRMRYAIFVNMIHSLDALHLSLITKQVRRPIFFPIHDAFLTAWTYNTTELLRVISDTFMRIHNDHKAFKRRFNRLAERLGSDWTYDKLIAKLNMIPPHVKRTGRMA